MQLCYFSNRDPIIVRRGQLASYVTCLASLLSIHSVLVTKLCRESLAGDTEGLYYLTLCGANQTWCKFCNPADLYGMSVHADSLDRSSAEVQYGETGGSGWWRTKQPSNIHWRHQFYCYRGMVLYFHPRTLRWSVENVLLFELCWEFCKEVRP